MLMKGTKRESRICKAYIREHGRAVLLFGMAVLVLFGMAALYDYRGALRNMSYGVLLTVFFGALYRKPLRGAGKGQPVCRNPSPI